MTFLARGATNDLDNEMRPHRGRSHAKVSITVPRRRRRGETKVAGASGADPRLSRVARGGFEPPTFRFSVGRSYQLSYLAVMVMSEKIRCTSLARVMCSETCCDPDGTRTRDLRRDRAAR